MTPYPTYKHSGIEWIGEIPEHWSALKIKRLSKVNRGASPRPIEDPKYFDDNGEFGWVRIADVTASERYLENTVQILSELGASLSVKRYPGDFFLSIAGTVGKPVITRIKCCIHDGFVYFPSLAINPEFLYYIFSTGLPYQGLGKWGTQLNLNTDTVGDIFIPIPDAIEIDKIVKFLDERTEKIDRLIANKQRLIALLREERTAIINQAVTRGLDKNTPLKPSGIDWLGDIPKHWELKKLKYVVSINDDVIGENTSPEYELLYVEISSISDGKIINKEPYAFQNAPSRARRRVNDGDIIVSTVRTYLKAIAPIVKPEDNLIVSTGFAVIRPRQIDSDYTNYLFHSEYIISSIIANSVGVSYPAINASQIGEIIIPIPPIAEQQAIATYITQETQKIDHTIGRIEQEIALMQEYRTALISEVVTGKINVSEQNPKHPGKQQTAHHIGNLNDN